MNMLIIDKKMLPMKDAGLPKMVMEQTPKRYQKAKLPIAKVKVGPQIMNMICDDAIFDELPTRGEVKAMVSGIYIISVKSVRGKKVAQEEETGKKKKGNWRTRMRKRQVEMQKQLNAEMLEKANLLKSPRKSFVERKKERRRSVTRCKNQPAKLKDIIGSFTPFLIAVLAQYVLNFIDVAILFFKNMRSDEKSNSENTIGKILQMDYNQPMNQAYLVLAQHIVFLICFGVWYYRIFYR